MAQDLINVIFGNLSKIYPLLQKNYKEKNNPTSKYPNSKIISKDIYL